MPLASTAVGVVEPARAGMASGINSTFRQVGIATGIAALGSIFASQLRHSVGRHAWPARHWRADAHALADTIASGQVGGAIAVRPRAGARLVANAARAGFVDGLNTILLIGAIVSFAGAVLALVLIRQRDYVGSEAAVAGAPAPA